MKTDEKEIWVEMLDFPTYEVSNLGNVRNAKTGRLLRVQNNGREYRIISLWYINKKYTKRVSRLIWASFNGCHCKETIDHINQNGADDRLENLRCVSQKENNLNKIYHKKINKYNLDDFKKGLIHYLVTTNQETSWTIMKKYGIPSNYIQTVIKRGTWKKYADEYFKPEVNERSSL